MDERIDAGVRVADAFVMRGVAGVAELPAAPLEDATHGWDRMNGGRGAQGCLTAEAFQSEQLAGLHWHPAEALAEAAGHARRLDFDHLADGPLQCRRGRRRRWDRSHKKRLASRSKMGSPARVIEMLVGNDDMTHRFDRRAGSAQLAHDFIAAGASEQTKPPARETRLMLAIQ